MHFNHDDCPLINKVMTLSNYLPTPTRFLPQCNYQLLPKLSNTERNRKIIQVGDWFCDEQMRASADPANKLAGINAARIVPKDSKNESCPYSKAVT